MVRAAVAIGVALMLLLSGCAGLTGDSEEPNVVTENETTTPEPTETETETETETDKPSLTSEDYAPGGGPESVGDSSALNATTIDTMRQSAHTLTVNIDATSSAISSGTITVKTSDAGRVLNLETDESDTEDTTGWFSGETAAISQTTSGETKYTVTQRDAFGVSFLDLFGETLTSQMVTAYSNAFHYEHVDAYKQNGMWVHEYQSTGLNESYNAEDAASSEIHGGNLTMVVREDGTVLGIDGTVEQETDGETVERTLNYELTNLGETTTEAPDWFGTTAPNVTGELTNDGRVLEITHNSGEPIPESASPTVTIGTSANEVDQSLAAGETLYVYGTENDAGEVTVHTSTSPPDVGNDVVDLREQRTQFTASMEGPSVTIRLMFVPEA